MELKRRILEYLGVGAASTPDHTQAGPAVEQLWAGWRIPYIEANADARAQGLPPGLTLFEGIEQSGRPDEETYIVWRGTTCFALLNAFPYTSGHLMVLPKRGVPELDDLTEAEAAELWDGVRRSVVAVRRAFRSHGVNIGINIGPGSGAGIPEHLHVHVVPRWSGDTNFTTTTANVRVIPESLGDSWRKLVAAWPT